MGQTITDQQFQELCEWAGFKHVESFLDQYEVEHTLWVTPDGAMRKGLPLRDMNTVSKWFVPKLVEKYQVVIEVEKSETVVTINYLEGPEWEGHWAPKACEYNEDPLEALLSAIWEVAHDN